MLTFTEMKANATPACLVSRRCARSIPFAGLLNSDLRTHTEPSSKQDTLTNSLLDMVTVAMALLVDGVGNLVHSICPHRTGPRALTEAVPRPFEDVSWGFQFWAP